MSVSESSHGIIRGKTTTLCLYRRSIRYSQDGGLEDRLRSLEVLDRGWRRCFGRTDANRQSGRGLLALRTWIHGALKPKGCGYAHTYARILGYGVQSQLRLQQTWQDHRRSSKRLGRTVHGTRRKHTSCRNFKRAITYCSTARGAGGARGGRGGKGGEKGTETAQTLDHVGRVRWREQEGEQEGEQDEPEIIANKSMNYLNS